MDLRKSLFKIEPEVGGTKIEKNMKYAIIDARMRKPEKDFLKSLDCELVELPKSEAVYEEISSHVDIFCCKVNHTLVVEKSCYAYLKSKLRNTNAKIVERKRECSGEISKGCFV